MSISSLCTRKNKKINIDLLFMSSWLTQILFGLENLSELYEWIFLSMDIFIFSWTRPRLDQDTGCLFIPPQTTSCTFNFGLNYSHGNCQYPKYTAFLFFGLRCNQESWCKSQWWQLHVFSQKPAEFYSEAIAVESSTIWFCDSHFDSGRSF